MKEQRTNPRRRVNETIEIIDTNTGERLGYLVNISVGGLMLLSDIAVSPNQLFQLRMIPPSQAAETTAIEFGAECLWVQDTEDESPCWAGFQIIDISEQGTSQILQLMADWTE
ncbi:MAG: PilZ domain-containing protein [Gammaproteobacteria bacterium]|nr:PilZ domain-containing protein [Gammaproteobacteria bacterium]